MSASPDTTTVTIPLDRLRALEAYEAAALAEKERARQRIAVLKDKYTPDPVEHSKRVLARYHENRDAILARRRELRKAKKEAAAAAVVTPTTA